MGGTEATERSLRGGGGGVGVQAVHIKGGLEEVGKAEAVS